MPVVVRKRRGKYRVVESRSGRIAKSTKGNASDGGGHTSREKANRQARAINSSLSRKRSKKR